MTTEIKDRAAPTETTCNAYDQVASRLAIPRDRHIHNTPGDQEDRDEEEEATLHAVTVMRSGNGLPHSPNAGCPVSRAGGGPATGC